MGIYITGLYAGILGIIMLILAMRVSGVRMKKKIAIGEGGSLELHEAVRGHGNFTEWVPYLLILMAISESNGVSAYLLHSVGAVLVLSRVLHPLGIKHNVIPHSLRAIGGGLSCLVLVVLSFVVIWQWVITR